LEAQVADDDVVQCADGLAEADGAVQGAGEADAVAAQVRRQRDGQPGPGRHDAAAFAVGDGQLHVPSSMGEKTKGWQAGPTSRRRPGAFTEPARGAHRTGNARCLSPSVSTSGGQKNNVPGKASRAKLSRGGTPQHDGLGKPPGHPLDS